VSLAHSLLRDLRGEKLDCLNSPFHCRICNLPKPAPANRRRVVGLCFAPNLVVLARPSDLARSVIGCAIEVHKVLGPGLLESAYESCLVHEFRARQLAFRRQVRVPLIYKGTRVNWGYRADLIVENELLLEVKCVDRVLPIHQAQVLTYLRLIDLPQALLINFNVRCLVDGVRSVLR
jgi:GxxExxY protein